MQVLIIYPHWHPSNLAGVHRPRLIGNFLPEFGWQPVVLTVDAAYFEEPPDPDFERTFAPHFEVHRVKALPVSRPRIIGDIGLRAFFQLRKAALKVLRSRAIDFIWIPIPSFYMANLGRILHEKTGVPYGIDYIDPWVRDISNRSNFRARLSQRLARMLEPHAVKKAALISGVAYNYFRPMLERNFPGSGEGEGQRTSGGPVQVAMPYGFDPRDHEVKPRDVVYPWNAGEEVFLYAGAFLPNSGYFMQLLFQALRTLRDAGKVKPRQKLYFVGTGRYTHKSITDYAREAGIQDHVREIRERYPFLHILHFLTRARGVMVIGSTEQHYTASKIYQALLSKQPVFAVFHKSSSAAGVMEECRADRYLVRYSEDLPEQQLQNTIMETLQRFISEESNWQPDLKALNKYSAKESARKLAAGMNKALQYANLKIN